MTKALIVGCAGPSLNADERAFLREQDPWGFILFKRNCETPEQIRALTDAFRACVGRDDAPVLIDQEGGRVQRLGPPHWPAYPSARTLVAASGGDIERLNRLAYVHGRVIADDLAGLGITVDCLPVLDVHVPETHPIIGDRSFGGDADGVARAGLRQAEGLMDGGVLPIMKHIPGHGRADVDSHLALPVVDTIKETLAATDFRPFRLLAAHIPMAMTAHVVFSALDPDNPATTSATVIEHTIRGDIGFDGLLMSDDLSMKALGGSFEERTAAAFAAGCDMVLHCNGDLAEMAAIATATPELSGAAARRAAAALNCGRPPDGADINALRVELEAAMSSTS